MALPSKVNLWHRADDDKLNLYGALFTDKSADFWDGFYD